jgi:hypothetical protein
VPESENPQALNRYAYVLNNPLRYSDPTGHKWDDGTKGGCTPKTCPKQLKWDPSKDIKKRTAKREYKLRVFYHLVATGNNKADSACTAYRSCDGRSPIALYESLVGQGLPSPDAWCAAGFMCGSPPACGDPTGWSCSSAAESISGGGSCSFGQAAYGEGPDCKYQVDPGGAPKEFLADAAEAIGDALTSECAQGVAGVGITVLAASAAATGVGALVESGGVVLISVSSAATSATAAYYAAGPQNVETILEFGPGSFYTVATKC